MLRKWGCGLLSALGRPQGIAPTLAINGILLVFDCLIFSARMDITLIKGTNIASVNEVTNRYTHYMQVRLFFGWESVNYDFLHHRAWRSRRLAYSPDYFTVEAGLLTGEAIPTISQYQPKAYSGTEYYCKYNHLVLSTPIRRLAAILMQSGNYAKLEDKHLLPSI